MAVTSLNVTAVAALKFNFYVMVSVIVAIIQTKSSALVNVINVKIIVASVTPQFVMV